MAFQMDYLSRVDKRQNPLVILRCGLKIRYSIGSDVSKFLKMLRSFLPIILLVGDGRQIFFETDRIKKNTYSVYYHHQLWGSGPHLMPIVPPEQTYKVIGQAIQKGDTEYCIMNVSNIREFQYGIKASSQIFFDYPTLVR
jgi:hypothetical protein